MMINGITGGYFSFIDRVSGIYRHLHHIGRISLATTIDSLVTNIATIIGIRDIAVVQGLPNTIDLDLPAARAGIHIVMSPSDLRCRQIKRPTRTDSCRCRNVAYQRFVVNCNLNTWAVSYITFVFGKIANPVAIVRIRYIIVV